jgi:hypothetical protein
MVYSLGLLRVAAYVLVIYDFDFVTPMAWRIFLEKLGNIVIRINQ